MTDLLVSVIVPVYNVEDYISECIESIQKQTYRNLQIILVDDGSTDSSGILCDEYAEQDRRIRVIHQPNGGLVRARKRGLEYAEGAYVGFVDGDDSIAPNMYQSLVDELEDSGADFVHSGIWKNGLKIAAKVQELINISQRDEKIKLLETVLRSDSFIFPSTCTKIFRVELIRKCYMQVSEDNQMGEDLINMFICVMESNKVALMDNAYYYYRVRDDSMTHSKSHNWIRERLRLYDAICEILTAYNCYQELEEAMDRYLWQRVFPYFNQKGYFSQVRKYFWGDVDILQGKKIIVYGAGRVGKDYYAQMCRYTDCKVVAWMDACPERYNYPHIRLRGIDDLDSIEFDLLLIAVKNGEMADEICGQLIKRGVQKNKIYWSKPEEFSSWNTLEKKV